MSDRVSLPEAIGMAVQASGQQINDLALVMLCIVRALEKQPGFDAEGFRAQMSDQAGRCDEKQSFAKLLFEVLSTPPSSTGG